MEVTQEEGLVVTGEPNDGGQVLEGEVKLEEEPEDKQTNWRSPRRTIIEELDVSDGKKGEHHVPPSEPSRAPSPERKEEEEPDGQQTNRQSTRQAPGELDEAEGDGPEKGDVAAIEKEHDLPPRYTSRAPPPEGKEETTEADAGVSRGRWGPLWLVKLAWSMRFGCCLTRTNAALGTCTTRTLFSALLFPDMMGPHRDSQQDARTFVIARR